MQLKTITLLEQTLVLHPLKAIYWVEEGTLLLADLHLGKAAHFRKAGIPVPQAVGDANSDRLIYLLLEFKPKKVIFLGDLFHSDHNPQWEEFKDLLSRFASTPFELVQGNHDILPLAYYQNAQLTVHLQPLIIGPFLLSHQPIDTSLSNLYNLAGHVHPCVWLQGKARQKMKLPCFYFAERNGLLPAFGAFTGTGRIQPKKGDRVYVIAEDGVIGVKSEE